jgi:hypothetical protein
MLAMEYQTSGSKNWLYLLPPSTMEIDAQQRIWPATGIAVTLLRVHGSNDAGVSGPRPSTGVGGETTTCTTRHGHATPQRGLARRAGAGAGAVQPRQPCTPARASPATGEAARPRAATAWALRARTRAGEARPCVGRRAQASETSAHAWLGRSRGKARPWIGVLA